jgi:hypothetical protein
MVSVPLPGPGRYALPLATPGFYLLLALLGTFGLMLLLLRHQHPRHRRGVEGYLEAASIDLGFLLSGLVLVVALATVDPYGNQTSRALYDVVLGGYWFSFSIPVVTVGASIHRRTRGGVPWLIPSVAAAVALFFVLFAYDFVVLGAA